MRQPRSMIKQLGKVPKTKREKRAERILKKQKRNSVLSNIIQVAYDKARPYPYLREGTYYPDLYGYTALPQVVVYIHPGRVERILVISLPNRVARELNKKRKESGSERHVRVDGNGKMKEKQTRKEPPVIKPGIKLHTIGRS